MLKIAKVTGLNSDTRSASLLVLPSPHHLFVVIYTEGEDVFAKSRQTLSEIEDLFTTSLGSISTKVQQIYQTINQSLKTTTKLDFLVSALSDKNALYLIYQGNTLDALLIRPQGISDLLSISPAGKIISGFIRPKDRVIFETKSLRDILGQDWERLISSPLDSFAEDVEAHLPNHPLTPVAAVVLEEPVARSSEEIIIRSVENHLKTVPKRLNLHQVVSFIKSAFQHFSYSKKKTAFYGAILLLVVILGIFLSFANKKSSQQTSQFNQSLQTAKSAYQKAESLKELNPPASRQSLEQAKSSLADALKIKPKDSKALELKKTIDETSKDIIKSYQVENPALWLDLSLIKKDLKVEHLSFSVGQLLLLDKNQKTLISVNSAKKSNQILSGQDKLKDATLASLNGDFAYAYSQDLGVIQIDTINQIQKVVVKKDEGWGVVKNLYVFAGNIYLLDSANNQIYKYLPTSSGFSDKRNYLNPTLKANLEDVKNMQIDSSVWVLKSSGEIIKYTQGLPDYFSLSGLETPLKNPTSFYVSSDTDNLYLLDSENSRVVILDKKGVYQKEFKNNSFKNFLDLVVDEENKKTYFLDGTKIYLMDLKWTWWRRGYWTLCVKVKLKPPTSLANIYLVPTVTY